MSADTHHEKRQHDYHLVDPSPWPLLGSISGFVLFLGFIFNMHSGFLGEGSREAIDGLGSLVFIPGVAMVLATMFFWWRDVVREATFKGDHTPVVQVGLRYGMVLFIASEVMFFVAFFWAYFDASLFADEAQQFARVEATGGVCPPIGVETFDAFDLPFMNTLILLLSGCTVTWAHHALRENNRDEFLRGLGITVLLGIAFTALQAYEYSHAAFAFGDNQIYSSTFYMATGFHGFHVLVGTIFLAVCWFRGREGHFSADHHFGFEAAAWYWHFVDVVWLFLFTCVYWWGG